MKMEEYIKDLEKNTNKVLETVKDYPLEKLTQKIDLEWSVLEVLEHIYMSDKLIYRIISKSSENESESKEIIGRNKLKTILIEQRKNKVQSPEVLKPKGYFKNLAEFNLAFSTLRKAIQNDLISKKLVVDNRTYNHPILGEMTVKDWLYFSLFHAERHLKQIQEKG